MPLEPLYKFKKKGRKLVFCICLKIPTFDLQLAGDGGFSLGVLGSAGVHATIEAARFTDLQ